jgi:hypothetical protein
MHHKYLSWLFERQSDFVHAMAIAKSAAGEIQASRHPGPWQGQKWLLKYPLVYHPEDSWLQLGGISKLVKQKKEKGDYLVLTVVRP